MEICLFMYEIVKTRGRSLVALFPSIQAARHKLQDYPGCYIQYAKKAAQDFCKYRNLEVSPNYGVPIQETICPACGKDKKQRPLRGNWLDHFYTNKDQCGGCVVALEHIRALRGKGIGELGSYSRLAKEGMHGWSAEASGGHKRDKPISDLLRWHRKQDIPEYMEQLFDNPEEL